MRAWSLRRCDFTSLDVPARRAFSCSRAAPERFTVAQLLTRGDDVDDHVQLHGWVRSLRRHKNVAFATIGDGSTSNAVQAVFKSPEQADALSVGTAVDLSGTWKKNLHGRLQKHELDVRHHVKPLGANDAEHSPLQPKYQTPEYLRTIPHLRPRIPANGLLLRLRSQVIASLTSFFHQQGFIQCHTPVITSSDCEGAGEVFTVSSNAAKDSKQHSTQSAEVEHFFRTPKYLTVSAQLHLEALSQAVDKVWTLSPTFRAEKSDTPRHLSEFYMLESELCFVEDLDQVMDVVEQMLMAIARDLCNSAVGNELQAHRNNLPKTDEPDGTSVNGAELERRWQGMQNGGWPRITYAEAVELLQEAASSGKADFVFAPTYEGGLQAEHERYVAATVGKNIHPVFVTDYPAEQKPFYMPPSTSTKNSKGTPKTAACFDLLVPELCELVGGSIREHRLADLGTAMEAKSVAGENLEWYKDLRRFGSTPHGGFGLGFDRLLCYLSGISNVRDVVAFPRWHGRCEC